MDYSKSQLVSMALQARKTAYSPYSNFAVGAALLAEDGRIFTGCNVENASFGATNCAERTAIFKAISEGARKFTAIAIAGAPLDKKTPFDSFASPCGICRQVLFEFADNNLEVVLVKSDEDYIMHKLGELLPLAFGSQNF